MTTETKERSFEQVMAELRHYKMHGVYLMLMAEAQSMRDLRAMHGELLPDNARLLREDLRVLEKAWKEFHVDAESDDDAQQGRRMTDDARRMMIREALQYVTLIRREERRGVGRAEYFDPVIRTADLTDYYVSRLKGNRHANSISGDRGNIRDPQRSFSQDDAMRSMLSLGLNTDFIAVIEQRCFEARLSFYSWVSGIEVYIMIPQQQLTEQLTHTLLSKLSNFHVAQTAWSEERGEVWVGFSAGADDLKQLLVGEEGVLKDYKTTPEFLPALNAALKETGIQILAQSALRTAS